MKHNLKKRIDRNKKIITMFSVEVFLFSKKGKYYECSIN